MFPGQAQDGDDSVRQSHAGRSQLILNQWN